MSNDLNQCQFIGRLGADVEARYLNSGKPVANFKIAVGSSWKSKDTGEKNEAVEWVAIVAFDKLAEICVEYLRKGQQVFIQGAMKTRKWKDKEGNDRYSTEIIASQMQMLGSRAEREEPQQRPAKAKAQPPSQKDQQDDFNDSVPFMWSLTGLFAGLMTLGAYFSQAAMYA